MSVSFKPRDVKVSATKRIMRDLRDLEKTPVPGLGVICPDVADPFNLHCNVLINDGPYKGQLIHLVLHIPDDYPLTGPAGNIAPGLEFDGRFHGHIHDDHRNGHALCNDMLTNYASFFRYVDDGHSKKASGWSPGYTLSTALLQIVTFFAEPDLRCQPSADRIALLADMVRKFRCDTCGHSFDQPVPAVADYSATEAVQTDQAGDADAATREKLEAEQEEIRKRQQIIERLTCGVTKQNALEDAICLGYPLMIRRDQRGRPWSDIVLELISYDAYVAEIQKTGGDKLDFYEYSRFRSVTGQDYNHWLPIFINVEHFERSRTLIENSISIIYSGTAHGSKQYDFKSIMALKVLTTLMNKSGVQLFNGELYESKQAIEAYCHFLRLLMHFIETYPAVERYMNDTIEKFMNSLANRNKSAVPDIGEFLILIALSRKYRFDEVKQYLYEEYFARQIFWIQKNSTIGNLLEISTSDLPQIFEAVKVSNHLLVFNLQMAQTFIFPGVKQHLDRLYGYPPEAIVEKFQQQLKAIKALDRYSSFVKAIQMDGTITTPEDMVGLIARSVKVSNEQGYTSILSLAEQQDKKHDDRRRYNQQQSRQNTKTGRR